MKSLARRGHAPAPWLLVLFYLAIGLAPLLISASMRERERSFAGELAVGAGLVAFSMLLMQFISSGRYERISGRVGIDRAQRFHQLAAHWLLAFALLHPALFALPQNLAELSRLPQQLWIMAAAPQLRSGVIALVSLAVLVPLGILRTRMPLRYEIWRGSHALLAVAAAAACLHHALSLGGYSRAAPLTAFWAMMTALALGSLGYAYVIKPVRLARRAYLVKSNQELAEGIRELILEPAGSRTLEYCAGQFVWASFGRWPFPLRDHPYSLASSPREGQRLRLLIKARGDFSAAAKAIAEGTPAYLDGPHGDFVLAGRSAGSIAFYAGGIGIAPVLGLLRDLLLAGERRPVALVYGARNFERLVGRDAIAEAEQGLHFKAHYVLEEPPSGWQGGKGAITRDIALRAIKGRNPKHCLCMLCGPTSMMLAIERALLHAGVPAHNIVYERFEYD